MTIEIDEVKALELLEAAVAERGEDFVYQNEFGDSCQYQVEGAPACLVGVVLYKAGVPLESLEAMDDGFVDYEGETYYHDQDISSLAYRSIGLNERVEGVTTLDALGICIDDSAIKLLTVAQVSQDEGNNWGIALREAKAAV